MVQYYVGVPAIGNPKNVLERIRQVVQRLKLTRTIPVVKVEKKPRKQFYVFLAVEGADGRHLPDTVTTVLKLAGLTGKPSWPLELEAIKPMTSTGEVETYRLNSLTYKPLWNNDAGDPFDISDQSLLEDETQTPEHGERYDQLLYWLSATAEGSWQTFTQVCKVLSLVEENKHARRILRKLILLGHIECSLDGSRWSICPPALVQSSADADGYFLAGQRTPGLLKQLGAHYELQNQWGYQGPTRIEIIGELSAENNTIRRVSNASSRIAEWLPDLEGWKDTLEPIDRLVTAPYEIEKWDGRRYSLCETVFQKEGQYIGESGLYRLRRQGREDGYRINLFFDQEQQRWLRGDWYGLRFLADYAARVDLEAVHNPRTGELMIPFAERWPLLYERALVLATGLLPTPAKNVKWLRYEGVSAELCYILTNKLNVSVVLNPEF